MIAIRTEGAASPSLIFVALQEFARYDRRPLELLERSGFRYRLNATGERLHADRLVETAADAEGVVAGLESYDAATLGRLPRLRCISRCGVGVDNIDLEFARLRGVAVLNTPDSPAEAVAELALAMMLALARNLPRQAQLMRGRRWERVEAHLIAGRAVALVGLGRIGRRLAELLAPFGMRRYGVDPRADAAWCRANEVTLVSLQEALAAVDFVSIQAAKDPRHPLRLASAELAMLRRGAFIVNVARGGMVDEGALYEALRSGHLAGAALDVYAEEPYQGRLCDLENVILTPHAATATVETRSAMETESVDKLIRFLRGSLSPDECVVAPVAVS